MAQKTDIRLRRSDTAGKIPTSSNLSDGELALNTNSGALYFKKSDDTIITAHDNTILHIDSDTTGSNETGTSPKVGINKTNPIDALDVNGKIRTNNRVLSNQYQSTSTFGMNFANSAGSIQMFKSNDGKLGIGTSSPSEILTLDDTHPKLALRDAGTERAFLQVDSADNFVINNKSISSMIFETSDTERMRLSSTGRLGIGETNPDRKLHVKDSNYRVAVFERTGAPNCFITFADPNTTQDVGVGATTNDLKFRSGNVDHLSLLGSNGHLKFTDFDQQLEFGSTSNKLGYNQWLMSASGGASIKNVAGPLTINPDDFTAFQVNDVEKARINATGLGIGTSSPGYKLDIGGTTGNTANTLRLHQTNGGTALRIGAGGGSSDVVLWRIDGDSVNSPDKHAGATNFGAYGYSLKYFGTGSGQENRLKLLADNQNASSQKVVYNVGQNGDITFEQKVGIGTTAPSQELHVSKASGGDTTIRIDSLDSPRNNFIGITGHDNLVLAADHNNQGASSSIRMSVDGTERLRIDADGNVGIGTNSPEQKLHIVDTSNPASTTGSVIIEGQRDGTANLLELRARDNSSSGSALPNGQGSIIRFTGFDGTDFEEMAFIGAQADGAAIANADAPSRLIFGTTVDGGGEATEKMRIDSSGAITFNTAYTFPTADGNAGQVLKTNGSGVLSFADDTGGGGSSASLTDADADTKIQVEEGTDDDTIRFDTAGTERMLLEADGNLRVYDVIDNIANSLTLNARNTGILLFQSGGNEKARIDSGGNLCIGNTSAAAKLDIRQDSGYAIRAENGSGHYFRVAATGQVEITNNAVDGTASLLLNCTEDSALASPILEFNRDSASPADADYLGQIKFTGENDQDQNVLYAKITGKIQDATDTTEDGLIEFMTKKAGANNISMRLRSDSLQLLNDTSLALKSDGAQLQFGNDNDMQLFHNGANGFLRSAGVLEIDVADDITLDAGGGDIRLKDDGTQFGRLANFLGSLVITSGPSDTAIIIGDANGNQIVGGDISLTDNKKLKLGAGNDLQIYHNGTDSYIQDTGTGILALLGSETRIQNAAGNENCAKFIPDGAVELYHNNSKKFETSSAGASVTGDLAISGNLTVSGTTTSVSTTNTTITDALIELGSGNTGANTNDLGLILERGTTGNNVFIGWDESEDKVAFGTTTATGSSTGNVSYSRASILANAIDLTNHLDMADNAKIRLGNSDDLEIYHDAINTHILNKTGDLVIKNTLDDIKILAEDDVVIGDVDDTTRFATFINGGAVYLFHNGTARLETTSTGINVTGTGTFTGGELFLGTADTSSGHINAFENMTFNIDSDNDDTNRFFEWNKNGNSGSGTELMRLTEDGKLGIGTSSPSTALHVNGEITIPASIVHEGDSDTFFGFHTNNQWRVVTGGTERIEVRDSEIVINDGSNDYDFRVESDGDSNCFVVNGGLNRVGIGTSSPGAKLQVEEYGIETTTTSTSATTEVAVASMSATTFRSARFTIQITNSADDTYHTTELLALHDGTTANITEFGTIFTGAAVEATFDADIDSGNFRLLATPSSTDAMVFKVISHSINV